MYEHVLLNVLCERFAHIYVYTHMNDDLVNRGDLKGVLKCILNYIVLIPMLCPRERIFSHDLG